MCRTRITISINADGGSIDQDLVTLELDLSLKLADFKNLVEQETKFPASTQEYYLDGEALRDDSKTLEELNVKDGEMLAMVITRSPQPRQRQAGQRRTQQSSPADPARIEAIRQELLASPDQMAAIIQRAPDLAEVVNDSTQFRQKWMDRIANENRLQRERENEIARLNEDPFNEESQRIIAERIRTENIERNLQYAYENSPEGTWRFGLCDVLADQNEFLLMCICSTCPS